MLLKARLDNTHIVLFGASPEVDTACIAGDVEDSQALQTRQRHGNPVTLWTEERRCFKTRKTQQVCRNQLSDICFPKENRWVCVHVRLLFTSSWTLCSRFLYVFWTSSLVPKTPYHIMFLVRLLQREKQTSQAWAQYDKLMCCLTKCN